MIHDDTYRFWVTSKWYHIRKQKSVDGVPPDPPSTWDEETILAQIFFTEDKDHFSKMAEEYDYEVVDWQIRALGYKPVVDESICINYYAFISIKRIREEAMKAVEELGEYEPYVDPAQEDLPADGDYSGAVYLFSARPNFVGSSIHIYFDEKYSVIVTLYPHLSHHHFEEWDMDLFRISLFGLEE